MVRAQDHAAACEAGDAKACFFASESYLKRESNAADKEKGLSFLKKSARLGAAPAYNQIGLLYLQGDVLSQDLALAHKCFYKAATKGYFMAFFNLAQMYANGIGVAKDATRAKMWLLLTEEVAPHQLRQSETFTKVDTAVSEQLSEENVGKARADVELFKNGLYVAPPTTEKFFGDPGF